MTTTAPIHPSRVPFDTAKGFTWLSPRMELQTLESLDKVREAMHSELAEKAADGDVKPPRLDLLLNYHETSRGGLNIWMSVRWHFSIFDLGRVPSVPEETRRLCGPIRDLVLRDALGNFVAKELGCAAAEFDDEVRSPSFKRWNLTLPPEAVERGWGEFR